MPLTLDNVIFTSENFNQVLRSIYKGYNFNVDLVMLNRVRRALVNWDELNYEKHLKAYNELCILTNVFCPIPLLRFFLYNLKDTSYPVIISLFSVIIDMPNELTVNDKTINTSEYIL